MDNIVVDCNKIVIVYKLEAIRIGTALHSLEGDQLGSGVDIPEREVVGLSTKVSAESCLYGSTFVHHAAE